RSADGDRVPQAAPQLLRFARVGDGVPGEQEEIRHSGWPLRPGRRGTDEVVESMPLRCSHYDAFRFFTPPARPLNAVQPTRSDQISLEQPGCLHANMDITK